MNAFIQVIPLDLGLRCVSCRSRLITLIDWSCPTQIPPLSQLQFGPISRTLNLIYRVPQYLRSHFLVKTFDSIEFLARISGLQSTNLSLFIITGIRLIVCWFFRVWFDITLRFCKLEISLNFIRQFYTWKVY